jgi:hypothetical protein
VQTQDFGQIDRLRGFSFHHPGAILIRVAADEQKLPVVAEQILPELLREAVQVLRPIAMMIGLREQSTSARQSEAEDREKERSIHLHIAHPMKVRKPLSCMGLHDAGQCP